MNKLRVFLEMIKFEHTIFALPFAYLGMVLAWGGWEQANWWDFIWISVAMAAARTAAMSLNRYIDRQVDVGNPRTAKRPIQTGAIPANTVLLFAILSLVILAVAAWQLDPLALYLFPGALLFLVGYAYTKRFTWLCHYVLGFTDGLAPMGGWVAVRGSVFTAEVVRVGVAPVCPWLELQLAHFAQHSQGVRLGRPVAEPDSLSE
jgi:4-hydroxybenzoate polyprenyltransferase